MNVSRGSRPNGPESTLERNLEGWAMALVPNLAVAYPMLIQPLINLKPVSAYAKLSDLTNVANADSNVVNQVFWLALFGFSIWLFRKRLPYLGGILQVPTVLFAVLYLAIAALSIFWSPVQGIAFRRFLLQAIVIATVLGPIYLCPQREKIVGIFVVLAGMIVLLNVFFVATQPPGRLGYIGIYSNKNILGVVAAICCLFLGHEAIVRKGYTRLACLGLIGAGLLVLLLSQSKTSLGFLFLAPLIAAALMLGRRTVQLQMAGVFLYALFVCVTVVGIGAQLTGARFQDVSLLLFGDDTFTGRTLIWNFVLGIYERSPIIGTGYASFWGTGTSSVAFLEAPGFIVGLLQAHNGYLDVMLETGVVGLAVLACFVLCSYNQAGRLASSFSSWLFLSVMLFVSLHNLLESGWFRGFGSQWVAFLFVVGLSFPPVAARRQVGAARAASPSVFRRI